VKTFVMERVLSDPHLKMKYTGGKCNIPSFRFERIYKHELNELILRRVLTLIVFLDGAKRGDVIPSSVLLFRKAAMVKSSQDFLHILCRDYISGIGHLPKYLAQVGVTVSFQQDPLDELEFTVSNLATDLRDGVRLGKLAEILGQSNGVLEQMRLPAISRLQKVFNVSVSLSALSCLGIPNVDNIHPNYIVDGHRPQVLKMLWSVMTSFELNSLLSSERLKQEIYAIHRSDASRVDSIYFSSLCGNVEDCDNLCDLLLVWCQAVCSCYNYTVFNFSASFADGIALCLLIHFYHPGIVDIGSILPNCVSKSNEWRAKNPCRVDKLIENERKNCLLAIEKMKDVGGVPNMFPVSDSCNAPDARTTIICVAYLCSRLLESSKETRAAVAIQAVVRRFLNRGRTNSNRLAVLIIERFWLESRHTYFRRQRVKYVRTVQVIENFFLSHRSKFQRISKERLRSTQIQVCIGAYRVFERSHYLTLIPLKKIARGYIAMCKVRNIRQEINAACTIEKVWRGFSTQRRYVEIRSGIIRIQAVVRVLLAEKVVQRMLSSVVQIQCSARQWLASQRLTELWVETHRNHRLLHAVLLCQVRMHPSSI